MPNLETLLVRDPSDTAGFIPTLQSALCQEDVRWSSFPVHPTHEDTSPRWISESWKMHLTFQLFAAGLGKALGLVCYLHVLEFIRKRGIHVTHHCCL